MPRLKPVGAGRPVASDAIGREPSTLVAEEQNEAVLRGQAEAALRGLDLDASRFDRIVADLKELRRDANAIQGRILLAGRHLLSLQAEAGEGGYKRLHEAGLVPFSETMASRLRAVAAAVDSGKLPVEHMPRALEAAALAARLPEPSLRLLIGAGVIKPDATVRDVREATRIKEPPPAAPEPLNAAERRKLERRREELKAEIARLRAELREIEARLARG